MKVLKDVASRRQEQHKTKHRGSCLKISKANEGGG